MHEIVTWLKVLYRALAAARRPDFSSWAIISRTTAIALAAEEAHRRSLRWTPPVAASFRYDRTPAIWFVKSNVRGRGFSIEVSIDDESGAIVDFRTRPR